MIKKLLIVLLLLLCLTGCVEYDEKTSLENLRFVFSNTLEIINYSQNNKSKYFSYYLPSDMTESDSDFENITLAYDQAKIVMNINIAEIISSKLYDHKLSDDGFFNQDKLYFNKSGSYTNIKNEVLNYDFNIYTQDNYFLLHFCSDAVNIYAYCPKGLEVETARHILLLAKTTTVDNDAVIENYSVKDVINYERQQIDLFQYVIPKNGYLSDLIKDEN